jgi:hypothetical protein
MTIPQRVNFPVSHWFIVSGAAPFIIRDAEHYIWKVGLSFLNQLEIFRLNGKNGENENLRSMFLAWCRPGFPMSLKLPAQQNTATLPNNAG